MNFLALSPTACESVLACLFRNLVPEETPEAGQFVHQVCTQGNLCNAENSDELRS